MHLIQRVGKAGRAALSEPHHASEGLGRAERSGSRTAVPIRWAERGLVPERLLRAGIRRMNQQRLVEIGAGCPERSMAEKVAFVEAMNRSPVALVPERANEQHYEVPADFFGEVMGVHRKYSCCYWAPGVESLNVAEADALKVTCERAGIGNGMHILELGCGWGSLSLWVAERYPDSRLLCVSNSSSQRRYILETARARGLNNIEVLKCDMNEFRTDQRFDRVVSIEMFEHMRNYAELFQRIETWLRPGGRFFMHIFCHRDCVYPFEDRGPADWMSRNFFSGGIMPSADLPLRFQERLNLAGQWQWNGQHYQKTANAWLHNMKRNRDRIMPVLERTYGPQQAALWFQRWRIFFMACAELFGYKQGREWLVGHYLFERRVDAGSQA